MVRMLASLFVLTLAAALPAHARCKGAVVLGGVHDAYRALLSDSGDTRTRAAMTLLVLLGPGAQDRLARQIADAGVEVSGARLQSVLSEARRLASQVMSGTAPPDDLFRHGLDADWLADLYIATGCRDSAAGASPAIADPAADRVLPRSAASRTRGTLAAEGAVAAALALAAAGGLGYVGKLVWNSFPVRRKRVDRLPRTPISMTVSLAYAGPDGTMQQVQAEALDISVGGLKLHWPKPPPAGTRVVLDLPIGECHGQLAWSNAFYAAAMFDQQLRKPDLETMLAAG